MTAPVKNFLSFKSKPFIKWVGGKRGLLPQLIKKFPQEFNNYHEPFLGGGAVFFELYSLGKLENKNIFLSDINAELINTYNVVKKSPLDLIVKLEEYVAKHSHEFYYDIRGLDREKSFKELSEIERATRFIYLNKTCFNGLYRVNKKGYFNTPIGSYKNPNIADKETILHASKALENVTIYHQPFQAILENVNENDFVYFDPPYYPLTSSANFTSYDANSFLEEEQFALYSLFEKLDDKKVKVAHSNSDTEFINNLYKHYDINTVSANRFINSKSSGRGKINEVLIRNKVW